MMAVTGMTPIHLHVDFGTPLTSLPTPCAAPAMEESLTHKISALTPTANSAIWLVIHVPGMLNTQIHADYMILRISLPSRCAVHAKEAVLTPQKEPLTLLVIAALGTKTVNHLVDFGIPSHSRPMICAVLARAEFKP